MGGRVLLFTILFENLQSNSSKAIADSFVQDDATQAWLTLKSAR